MDKKRLLSIDTLRGMDMLLIMGLSTLIVRLCQLFPGGADFWLARQMSHVQWNGLAIMDMVTATAMRPMPTTRAAATTVESTSVTTTVTTRVAAMAAASMSATTKATRAAAAATARESWSCPPRTTPAA